MIRLIKFGIIGILNTAIDFFLFIFFVQILHWHILPANIFSYSAGILNSFVMNKIWTFRDRRPFSRSLNPFIRFIIINLSSLILSTFIVWLLNQYFHAVVSKVISIVITFIWNFTFSRLFVFLSNN